MSLRKLYDGRFRNVHILGREAAQDKGRVNPIRQVPWGWVTIIFSSYRYVPARVWVFEVNDNMFGD